MLNSAREYSIGLTFNSGQSNRSVQRMKTMNNTYSHYTAELGRTKEKSVRYSVNLGLVRLDQRQEISFQFTANKPDVPRFSLVVDYPSLLQFWKMGMVKCDSDALSVFV